METFNFPIQTKPQGATAFRTRGASFGDGYEQRVGDGLNARRSTWNISFDGTFDEARLVRAFIDRHAGYIKFQWTPPGRNTPAYFLCDGYNEVPHVGSQVVLQATFREVFIP